MFSVLPLSYSSHEEQPKSHTNASN
uniref:Uncharacterized protein n=1 Tax=Arundo donax TaxID=35708 RepID=A0A0A9HAH4_ARUDO